MERTSSKLILLLVILTSVFAVMGYVLLGDHKDTTMENGSRISEKDQPQSLSVPSTKLAKTSKEASDKQALYTASDEEILYAKDVTVVFKQFEDLRKHPSPEAVNILSGFLNHENGVVVAEAIDTLGFIGLNSDQGAPVFTILEEKAMDKDFSHRGHALLTAAMIGKDQLLPVVSEYIFEEDDSTCEDNKDVASRALSLISSPACVPYLNLLLKDADDPKIRGNCFRTLARIDTHESLSILQEHVLSSRGKDQVDSALALAGLNRYESNQVLATAIEDRSFGENTIRALCSSPAAPDVFGQLLSKDEEKKEKKIALLKDIAKYSLHGTSDVRSQVSAAIVPLLDSPDNELKIQTIKAIGQLGGQDAAGILVAELSSDNSEVRKEAVFALVGHVGPANYTALLDVIWDNDEKTRRTAMFLVEQFVTHDDREILEKATRHEDEFIREHAKALLMEME